jgi:uncharacterized membrane protein YgcG
MKTVTTAAKKKAISFKTKDGKDIVFKTHVGVTKAKQTARVKMLEKRLTAMEKAVLKYNHDILKSKEKKQAAASDGNGGTVGGSGGGAGDSQGKRGGGVKGGGGGNGGKLVGHAGVKKV